MTLLVASVFADSPDSLKAEVEEAIRRGADAVELRLDLMEGVSDAELRNLRRTWPAELGVVITIRSVSEGGHWDGPDDARVSRLIELGPLADFVDVELELWRRSANVRQKIHLALSRAGHISREGGVEEIERAQPRKLILSRHDPMGRPDQLHSEFLEMMSEPLCAIPKFAWRARTVRDNFEAFELLRTAPRPSIVICMGEEGIASRVLAKKFGARAVFASVAPGIGTAPGQLSLGTLKRLYRWDKISAATRVFGVVGDPVAHSLGPAVHNAAFGELREDAVYLPFRVLPGYESFKAFMVEVLSRPWLDVAGLSVTIPHKENALRFLRESDGRIHERAARLGAVNTLLIDRDGHVRGENTDYDGGLKAILAGWGRERSRMKGGTACVLGAGGVARAVVAALRDSEVTVSVFNRTRDRGDALAHEFGCRSGGWEERLTAESELLVNCTSLGLEPRSEETPMPRERLGRFGWVFDTVYRPRQTRLLREAAESGCVVIDGLGMFLEQAAGQLRGWFGKSPSIDRLRGFVEA